MEDRSLRMSRLAVPSWTNLYQSPLSQEEREKLALRALQTILKDKMLPFHQIEQAALESIVRRVERVVRLLHLT